MKKAGLDRAYTDTSFVYSKANFVGQPDVIQQEQSLKLVFKQDNIETIDIANTTINFTLNIYPGYDADSLITPLVLGGQASDIFSVESLFWNGTQLNMQKGNRNANMYWSKIIALSTNKPRRLNQGSNYNNDVLPLGGTGVTGLYAMYGSRDGYVAGMVDQNQTKVISVRERLRLASEVQKHYITTPGDLPTYEMQEDDTQKQYSVRLGDICPELIQLSCVKPQMFQGSGLEINLVLLHSKYCMMRPPTPVLPALHPPHRFSMDTYGISNLFMGLVFHKTLSPDLGFYTKYPFMSIYSSIAQCKSDSITHQFSLGYRCYVRGLILVVVPQQMKTTAYADDDDFGGSNLLALEDQGSVTRVHNVYQGYFQNLQLSQLSLQVGSESYPRNLAPPVSNSHLFSYILAQQQSPQILGLSYSPTFADFQSISYATFIPINRFVAQGEIWQANLSFAATDDFGTQKQAQFLVVCDRVLEFGPGGQTFFDKGQI